MANPTITQTVSSAVTSAQTPAPTPITKTWQQVVTFQGSGIKNTQTFHITVDQWRINWSTKPGQYGNTNFQIYVYSGSGGLESVAANIIGAGNDTSYMHGS